MSRKHAAGAWNPYRGPDRLHPKLAAGLDAGIARAVRVIREAGVETFESCEGGSEHAYPEPTVRFHGNAEEGWRALAVCLTFGLPVSDLRRFWSFEYGEPRGPHWEITFRADRPGLREPDDG